MPRISQGTLLQLFYWLSSSERHAFCPVVQIHLTFREIIFHKGYRCICYACSKIRVLLRDSFRYRFLIPHSLNVSLTLCFNLKIVSNREIMTLAERSVIMISNHEGTKIGEYTGKMYADMRTISSRRAFFNTFLDITLLFSPFWIVMERFYVNKIARYLVHATRPCVCVINSYISIPRMMQGCKFGEAVRYTTRMGSHTQWEHRAYSAAYMWHTGNNVLRYMRAFADRSKREL